MALTNRGLSPSMSTEVKKEIQLEIAHVLFSDIVGYSRLLINEQRALRDTLTQIVRDTEEFQTADAEGKLIKIPTGDGMALVFSHSPEEPVECALEISRALQGHPELHLRMGVHSGPVSGVIDVNGQASVAGAGINMAQRVMDCGDAGHILLSKRVADDLEQYPQWRSILHDLGDCEVKHGLRLHLVNLYTEELGNPELPEKLKSSEQPSPPVMPAVKPEAKGKRIPLGAIAAGLLVIGALVSGVLIFSHRSVPQQTNAPATPAPSTPAPSAPAISTVPTKSIAVLPFDT